jgi:uncharacterized protein (DUF1778 family)
MDRDADYYQQHKDDTEEWNEPLQSALSSRRRRLDAMVSIRLRPDEAQLLRDVAESVGLSLSQFVRDAALRSAHQEVGLSLSPNSTMAVVNVYEIVQPTAPGQQNVTSTLTPTGVPS